MPLMYSKMLKKMALFNKKLKYKTRTHRKFTQTQYSHDPNTRLVRYSNGDKKPLFWTLAFWSESQFRVPLDLYSNRHSYLCCRIMAPGEQTEIKWLASLNLSGWVLSRQTSHRTPICTKPNSQLYWLQ